MDLSNLRPAEGSTHKRKRLGRGEGSGRGGTSTRGHKGAQSRSGYSRTPGFEGGQMPLQRRVPKYGFTPLKRVEYKPINLSDLQRLADEKKVDKVNPEVLVNAGLAGRKELIKILAKGELTAKLDVEAHAFSKAAEEAITAAGGTTVKL